MDRTKDGQILQQLQQAALFGCGAVVEHRGVNLGSEVEQGAHFVLKLSDKFVFR
jgi:hypothetical protein